MSRALRLHWSRPEWSHASTYMARSWSRCSGHPAVAAVATGPLHAVGSLAAVGGQVAGAADRLLGVPPRAPPFKTDLRVECTLGFGEGSVTLWRCRWSTPRPRQRDDPHVPPIPHPVTGGSSPPVTIRPRNSRSWAPPRHAVIAVHVEAPLALAAALASSAVQPRDPGGPPHPGPTRAPRRVCQTLRRTLR